ncbi:hypothetical protein LTR17_009591 [Elasticomyces elasticus]|nr:hypothetical protein LTR17_009591 [Elasticomyces elasticus]
MRFTAILRSVAVLYTEHVAKVMKPMEKEQCEMSIQHHSAKFNLENKRGATRALVKSTRFVFAYTLTLPDAPIQNNTVLKHFGAAVRGRAVRNVREGHDPRKGDTNHWTVVFEDKNGVHIVTHHVYPHK